MKKFFLAVALPATLILFSCNTGPGARTGDTITLKFNLPKGAGYDYNMDMDMTMKGNVNGQAINMNNKMAMGYRFGVTGDSAGWKKLTATITRIAMNVNSGGVNIDYDSDKPSDSSNEVNNTMGKVIGAMKGGEFSFTMNEKGEVGQVTGINDMMQRMMSSINVPNADAMVAGMSSAFNEENFKQNIQQAFAVYPGKPVKPGDSWTSSMDMNNGGMAMKTDNSYTLESVNGDKANVKVDSKISSPATTANNNVNITGTMKGAMQYDIPTGVPIRGDLDMNMDMQVSTGGQSVPMNTDIKMKITGKKS